MMEQQLVVEPPELPVRVLPARACLRAEPEESRDRPQPGSVVRVGPLTLRAANLVHAREPCVDGVVVVRKHGPQRVGPVRAEPELRIQIANQRVAVFDVLDAAVHAVDVAQLAAHFHALLAIAGGRIGLRARVARCHLVGELKLLADEVESSRTELKRIDRIRLTQRGRIRGKLVRHRVDDGRRGAG